MFLNVWGVVGGLFFLGEERVLLYLDVALLKITFQQSLLYY